jgi:hypothetical protein
MQLAAGDRATSITMLSQIRDRAERDNMFILLCAVMLALEPFFRYSRAMFLRLGIEADKQAEKNTRTNWQYHPQLILQNQ